MKRLRVLGLCVGAAFVLSALLYGGRRCARAK